MHETGQICLGVLNNCIYYTRQTLEIYHVLLYSMDFKVPGERCNPLSKTVLS